ncbi:hypothetical protein BDQ17DRAFT_1205065, partial [Cyathus striatus]
VLAGYGHATRVSAFARHLLAAHPPGSPHRPTVHLVSSAPQHVFADSIAEGAVYRYAEIDPVIVQPLAYRVDRRKSVEVLTAFLAKKDALLERECQWLLHINATAVLSDAAFLACLAAKTAGIPSLLVTNFTFDSVYSYLATPIPDGPATLEAALCPDLPVSSSELEPLVHQIHAGYLCADILLLLPGYIPIPSFFPHPPLPSPRWINAETNRFHPQIAALVSKLHECDISQQNTRIPRSVRKAPLLVRLPSQNPSVYTPDGRTRLLSQIGVPMLWHDPHTTKILVVSFGGQVFHRPNSRTHSRNASSTITPPRLKERDMNVDDDVRQNGMEDALKSIPQSQPAVSSRLATPSHIWIPGAPPASKPLHTPVVIPASPINGTLEGYFPEQEGEDECARLLPDGSWIAIVCGVSKEQWKGEEELPEGFYVAPKDVYMPDLTASADVLLGKLGYGTVSECVDSCTPFVYVSRPLFIEEHGLRLLLESEGVGVELGRQSYEAGDWASAVEEAWAKGRESKGKKR